MRIRRIAIRKWRNFRDVTITLPDDASLVCLVGANGTGKTHVLELISACAHHIGLSPGIEIPRGNPLADDERDFEFEFYYAKGVSEALDTEFGPPEDYNTWDRTIRFEGQTQRVLAGGIDDPKRSNKFATLIVARLRASQEVHHLTLDADRAFPKRDLPGHEMAQLFDQNWHDLSWNKGRAYQTTRTLYDEWIKYCLARENKSANLLQQAARRAADTGSPAPPFTDPFKSYRASLKEVLPHVVFAGADQDRRAVLFDTSGKELRFDQLSGGEREIAFLIGQIDRFGLKNGLFLLDEPELHLNPDLVRSWVTYLSNTVATGQIWLATHSLEAVEAAGMYSTLLLERNAETKLVDKVGSLSDRPVLSALSRAVGTPAFAMTSLRFVFIEGEEAIGERERYRRVTGLGADTRFIESGPCSEVIRRLAAIQAIASEAGQSIRVSGVIDRDWRTSQQIRELTKQAGLFALPVHEVENLFLHPETLAAIAKQNGVEGFDYRVALLAACDNRAGGWIIQSALSDQGSSDISELPTSARSHGFGLSWEEIEREPEAAIGGIVSRSGFDTARMEKLQKRLLVFAKIYSRKRMTGDLWKVCEGKEILSPMARALNFSNAHALEAAVVVYWASNPGSTPEEVKLLRDLLMST